MSKAKQKSVTPLPTDFSGILRAKRIAREVELQKQIAANRLALKTPRKSIDMEGLLKQAGAFFAAAAKMTPEEQERIVASEARRAAALARTAERKATAASAKLKAEAEAYRLHQTEELIKSAGYVDRGDGKFVLPTK